MSTESCTRSPRPAAASQTSSPAARGRAGSARRALPPVSRRGGAQPAPHARPRPRRPRGRAAGSLHRGLSLDRPLPRRRQDHHLALSRLRQRRAAAAAQAQAAAPRSRATTSPSARPTCRAPRRPSASLDNARRLDAVYRILDELSPKKRVVFILHEIEGREPKEIAGIVGAPVLTVRTRLHYARKEFYARAATDPRLDGGVRS